MSEPMSDEMLRAIEARKQAFVDGCPKPCRDTIAQRDERIKELEYRVTEAHKTSAMYYENWQDEIRACSAAEAIVDRYKVALEGMRLDVSEVALLTKDKWAQGKLADTLKKPSPLPPWTMDT